LSARDELLAGYLAHAEAVAHGREDQHSWAFDEFLVLIRTDPEKAWDITLELVSRASDDATLGYVAAGPLEDLMCEHGPLLVDHAEERARRDPRFRKALKGVWGWNRMAESIRARIDLMVANEPPW
jgi:hypothetical protein